MRKSKKDMEKDIQQKDKLIAEWLLKNELYIKLINEYKDLDLFGQKRRKMSNEQQTIMDSLPKKLPNIIKPSSKYFKPLQRYKELQQEADNMELRRTIIMNEIRIKFNLRYPYSFNELESIADGNGYFLGELNKIVDIIQLRPTQFETIKKDPNPHSFCFESEVIDKGYLDEEGFLHFKIKAGEPRKKIHHLLDTLLNMFEPPKKKERFRIGKLNPYEIAFKETVEGKNRLQIAKEIRGLSNIKGHDVNPAVDSEMNAKYKQVIRASKSIKKINPKK